MITEPSLLETAGFFFATMETIITPPEYSHVFTYERTARGLEVVSCQITEGWDNPQSRNYLAFQRFYFQPRTPDDAATIEELIRAMPLPGNPYRDGGT